MERIEDSVEVGRDLRTVYDQWTQFEEFPRFMDGVDRVVQQGDRELVLEVSAAGRQHTWRAWITQQLPDRAVAWQGDGDLRHDGRVTFHELGPDRTRLDVLLQYQPPGAGREGTEGADGARAAVARRLRRDLDAFKAFVEQRGETGAWRGQVHTEAVREPGATSRVRVERDAEA